MSINAHHARAVPAARIVAHEPGIVVARALGADRAFELRDDGQGREGAVAGGADEAVGRDGVEGSAEALEGERVGAGAAAERQGRAVFEADGVRDLAFEGGDVCVLV